MKNKTIVYTFKPMKRLTFWALLLMGIEIAGTLTWALGMVLSMAATASGSMNSLAASLLIGLGALLFVGSILISGVVSLCWIYGASRNAHALRPGGLVSTPGWAVGWFFVPFMSLYKPFESLRDIWIASRGPINGTYTKGSPTIVAWWLLFIAGNVILRLSGDGAGDGIQYAPTAANVAMVIGLLAIATSTTLFFIMIRQIHRFQITSDTRLAETF